jgi:serine/threonine protein phosphatase 1
MMLRARDDPESMKHWIWCGGDAVLKSYAPPGRDGTLLDVPVRHWQFIEERLLAWYEIDTHFFVHANAWPDYPLDEQPDLMLYWEPLNWPPPHQSGKVMVCGHTSQKTGLPKYFGHAVCIDTWACGEGWLTCLDPATGQYWQANQKGETRNAFLDELD